MLPTRRRSHRTAQDILPQKIFFAPDVFQRAPCFDVPGMRLSLIALLTVLMAALLTAPATADTEPTVHEGTIDGANYLVKVPDDWNGTLVLFSHGYYPEA